MFKKSLALAIAAGLLFSVAAQASEADVKKAVEGILGKNAKIDSVKKAGVLGLYEVVVGGEIAYVDEKANYIIFGNIVDVKAKKDLTEERKLKLAQIKFSDLPLDLAIKQVKGNGKRVIATFEDPNCGYCKKLAKELVGMTDVTIYTFLYPILSPDSLEKSKAIWCASDKVKAWNDWMVNGAAPAAGKCDTSAVEKSVALGQKLSIRGTPTIFFTDGNRAPGYMPVAQLEKAIAAVGN
ncbi:DsbC family protein [Sulfurisoma sediminicola]|uniref:Thiol:disulfide interchange protein n=1 Tax=Sulfurisoma sediminicola TaxID=1381557 RepID=A0A497XJ49_9PROT|nr:DsbC family protein [Sulfurisoma sediminicola]RLJ67894.1 thiol:disulfide interchange protein DsbC [Sulfurisoma sediminicola]